MFVGDNGRVQRARESPSLPHNSHYIKKSTIFWPREETREVIREGRISIAKREG